MEFSDISKVTISKVTNIFLDNYYQGKNDFGLKTLANITYTS